MTVKKLIEELRLFTESTEVYIPHSITMWTSNFQIDICEGKDGKSLIILEPLSEIN